ncbi:hypothetical protein P8452_19099 [Trifolium repens]|nr:hypothetical protein P8452_19099 [Trifolium repens]
MLLVPQLPRGIQFCKWGTPQSQNVAYKTKYVIALFPIFIILYIEKSSSGSRTKQLSSSWFSFVKKQVSYSPFLC